MSNQNFPKIPKIALRKSYDECKQVKNAKNKKVLFFFHLQSGFIWICSAQPREDIHMYMHIRIYMGRGYVHQSEKKGGMCTKLYMHV
mgnify:CR=1 FL=1